MSKASRFKIAARYELPEKVQEELKIQKYAAIICDLLKPCSEIHGMVPLLRAAAVLANNVSHRILSDDVKKRIVKQVLSDLCATWHDDEMEERLGLYLDALFLETPRVSFYQLTQARAWNLLKNVARKL